MKKFIVFCLILIVTVSLGVTVYYFMRDNEELVVNTEPYIYVNKGEIVEVDASLKNAKIGNDVIVTSLNENVLSFNPALSAFTTEMGGAAIIEVKTKSNKIPAIYIEVHVGDGSKEAPYYIDSEEDLVRIGTDDFNASSHYILMQDIALANSFTPLLLTSTDGLTGSLNGNGFTISNLNISSSEGVNNAGLFAKIGSTGIVTNLNLNNVIINGQFETAGSIAGINLGTINRCSVSGSVTSTLQNSYVGGVAGITKYSNANVGRIDRTSSYVSVSGTTNVGGLTGKNEGAILVNSYVYLTDSKIIETISESSNIGGLVGYNTNLNNQPATIKNCYSIATIVIRDGVNSANVNIASLVGYNDEFSSAKSNNFMGVYTDNTTLSVANHEFERTFTQEEQSQQKNYRGLYNTFPKDVNNQIIQNDMFSFVSKVLDNEERYKYWDFTNVWMLDSNINNGYPSLNNNGADVSDELNLIYNPEEISNAADLLRFASEVNNGTAGSYYSLTNDIVLTGDFTPIGTTTNPFTGTFEGNGFTISNLNISATTIQNMGEYKNKYAGLFGKISSTGVIQNLKLNTVTIASGSKYAGSVAAYNEGTISNVTVTQTARNKDAVNIIAHEAVGGITGVNLGLIENCKTVNQTILSQGLTKSAARYAGGITGLNGLTNNSANAVIKSSSVVTSYIYDSETNTDYPSDFMDNYTAWITWERPFVEALTQQYFFLGGIAGGNFYQITSNYVYNTDLKTDQYAIGGAASGVAGYSQATALINKGIAELTYNKVVGGTISGFCASGLSNYLYGTAKFNHIEADTIHGFMIAGLVNDVKVGGRLNNCFVKSHLKNSYTGGRAAGMTNYARYQSDNYYGEFVTIFSACTFENTNENSRYDSNADYRQESNVLWTTRYDGFGNHLIWVNTGHATYDESNYFGDSRQNDIYGISNNEAKLIENVEFIISLFTNNGFSTANWEFTTMEYPIILNLPEIEEGV
ncbi:MAG: hypothetical protein E7359_00350 [Clostridiales bacterium]|nr:hypothetical protein [Clostridiales bacterium]